MQNNTENQVYAGFFVRLAAYLIDWVIVGVLLLAIRIPIWIVSIGGMGDLVLRDFIFQYSLYDIILYLLKVTYFVLLTFFTGSTLGKKLLQIRVISIEDRKPTFFEIVFRESVGKFLSTIILEIGYIMIGADKRKRGLHDILSDTYVVYYHQKKVAVPTPVAYQTVSYRVPVQNSVPQKFSTIPNPIQNKPLKNQAVASKPEQQMPGKEQAVASKPEQQMPGKEQAVASKPEQQMPAEEQAVASQPEQPVKGKDQMDE